jgi:ABC-type transport system involved in multi-copper enzyme maturation permease subunit
MFISDLHLPILFENHIAWLIVAVVVLAALFVAGVGRGELQFRGSLLVTILLECVYAIPAGARDFGRLSWRRLWAISSVCFQESIRRRVLWITPLAILGVIVSVQLLQPIDEQDAVRQTVKYALFATGTLIVLATIILACTNLPKEIDNRVIYTVVTKPTTRLEIILGKIVGFARVSGTLLVIMGVFTLAYAGLRATHLRSRAKARLQELSLSDATRPTLQHYVDDGLLQAKTYVRPADYQEFAQIPKSDDKIRWMNGNEEQAYIVGFDLPPELFPPPDDNGEQHNGGLVVLGAIPYAFYEGHQDWHPTPFPGPLPDPHEFKGFSLKESSTPLVTIEVLGPERFNLVPPTEMPNGGSAYITGRPVAGHYVELTRIPERSLDRLYPRDPDKRRIYIHVTGVGRLRYGATRDSIRLASPLLQAMGKSPIIEPLKDQSGQSAWPVFRGRETIGGQQLRGGADLDKVGVGVLSFRGADVPTAGPTPMELRVTIEGSGDDVSGRENLTSAVVQVHNLATGKTTDPIEFPIESNRPAFFNVPADATAGGNFDVYLRCIGPGHYLVLRTAATNPSLQAVAGQEPFVWNLLKSLAVMWLMSLLVVIVSVFCSTFVSWPIAVVLTMVILIGHWGAVQIGDSNAPGLGAQMAKDLGLQDPAKMKVFGSAVDSLSKLLNTISKWLPDISQFAATEDIERGMSLAPHVLKESIKVILMFGVPLTVWAYVFLKRKEVAP